jgi:LEA14-like dessication related protein
MKRILVLATTTVAVLVAAGCSALGKAAFADPVVNLRDVKVVGLGLTGGNLDVVLSVYNPNNFRLDASKLNYRLQVDSTPLANGTIDNRFTVQDKDSTQVHIPVTFSWSGLNAGVRSIFNTGAVNYRVLGDITVSGGPGLNFTVPFSQTGRYSTLGR